MLTKIEISNINSIGKTTLDFTKAKYKFLENMIMDEVVNPIAFYGHNGSGKTAVISALYQLVSMMIEAPDVIRTFTINRVNLQEVNDSTAKDKGRKRFTEEEIMKLTSSITLYYTLDNKDYCYYIATTALGKFIAEGLFCEHKIVFEKEENEEYSFPLLRKLYTNVSKDERINKSYEYISNFATILADRRKYQVKSLVGKNYLDFMVEKSDEVKKLFKEYKEFPIYTIQKDESIEAIDNGKARYFCNLESGKRNIKIPMTMISSGMEDQSFLLSVVLSLPNDSLLIVDELEQALHPSTIQSFLKVINDKKIQLIFSSHNTNILQGLRPDQIYFANWKDGFSNYGRLSNIYPNIREINNIEKMYLANLFDDEIKNG